MRACKRIRYMAETISAEMIIHDVVTKHPETVKVFHGHGLPCTACAVGSRESIAGGARTHRFTPEKQALLLKDLNAVVKGEPISVAPKKAPVGRGIPLTMAPAGKDGTIKQVIAIMSGKGCASASWTATSPVPALPVCLAQRANP